MKVVGANLENGLLTVNLRREVPEALKPRRIPIGGMRSAAGRDAVGQDNAQPRIEAERKTA